MTTTHQETARALLETRGTTYAEQAGITLADKPSPLYRLLVLATLLSTRIDAGIAVAAARELSAAGFRTPQQMLEATWQQRVDALGRVDGKALEGAGRLGLPEDAEKLDALISSSDRPRFAAALVCVALEKLDADDLS